MEIRRGHVPLLPRPIAPSSLPPHPDLQRHTLSSPAIARLASADLQNGGQAAAPLILPTQQRDPEPMGTTGDMAAVPAAAGAQLYLSWPSHTECRRLERRLSGALLLLPLPTLCLLLLQRPAVLQLHLHLGRAPPPTRAPSSAGDRSSPSPAWCQATWEERRPTPEAGRSTCSSPAGAPSPRPWAREAPKVPAEAEA